MQLYFKSNIYGKFRKLGRNVEGNVLIDISSKIRKLCTEHFCLSLLDGDPLQRLSDFNNDFTMNVEPSKIFWIAFNQGRQNKFYFGRA